MAQNTVRRDRVGGHARLADVLGQGMHDHLVQVLDDAIVRAIDMDADLGRCPGVTSIEPGEGDRAEVMVAGPGERAHDVGRTAR